jgi:hypothetical protein
MSPSSPSPAFSFLEIISHSLSRINVIEGSEEAIGYNKRLKQCLCSKLHNFIALYCVLCMYVCVLFCLVTVSFVSEKKCVIKIMYICAHKYGCVT